MKKQGKIPVSVYFTDNDERTCIRDVRDGQVCPFFGVSNFGMRECCLAVDPSNNLLYRRDWNGDKGLGHLIPHKSCPVIIEDEESD